MITATRTRPFGRWAGFLLYGLLAGVAFLYLLFPVNRLERFAVMRLAEATALQLDPQERRVGFPLNVEWQRIRVTNLSGARKLGLQGDQVSLRFAVLPLLERKVYADYRFGFLGGEVSGVVEWQDGLKPHAYFLRGTARDLKLFSFLPDALVTRLRADWEYHWDPPQSLNGQGQATIEVSDVTFHPALAGMPPTTFRRLTARVVLHNGMATVEGVRGEGEEGSVRGGGTVILRNDFSESVLNLALEFHPREGAGSPLATGPSHFMIKGPVRSPSVFVNDMLVSSSQSLL